MKVILWDWDNTLVDTFGAIFAAQNEMRKHFNLPEWSKEESKKAMNTSGRNLIKDMLGEEKAAEARAVYLEAYARHSASLSLKEGATTVLTAAKELGFVNILASNKAGHLLRQEVQAMGIQSSFDKIIGAEDTQSDKPKKEFTDAALSGLNPVLLLSVGDGKSDIQMARNYPNAIGILVGTNPNSSEFENLEPDFSTPDLNGVLSVLKKQIKKTEKNSTKGLAFTKKISYTMGTKLEER